MALTIADSDVLIDALNGRDPAAQRLAAEIRAGNLATTAISRFEVLSGAKTENDERWALDLLDALATLPFDTAAADAAARARKALEKAGRKIGMGDSLIAGIVLAAGGTLLTRNRREFDRVDGLRVESP